MSEFITTTVHYDGYGLVVNNHWTDAHFTNLESATMEFNKTKERPDVFAAHVMDNTTWLRVPGLSYHTTRPNAR